MKVLLHICCGPCAIYCVNILRKEAHNICGFFYNPNIYPASEYDKRKDAVGIVAKELDVLVHFYRDYEFEDFTKNVKPLQQKQRCQQCWQLRLKHTAEFAKRENYDAFTTTLLISPYQDHNRIKDIATDLASHHNINFFYKDFRPGFRQSHNLSRKMGLYHQKYCGCVYSQKERALC